MYSMYPPAVTPLLSLVLLNSSVVVWPAMVVDLLLSGGVAVMLAVGMAVLLAVGVAVLLGVSVAVLLGVGVAMLLSVVVAVLLSGGVAVLLSGGVAVLLAVGVAVLLGWWYLTCLSSTFDCHHSDGVACTIVQSCQVVVGAITCSVD